MNYQLDNFNRATTQPPLQLIGTPEVAYKEPAGGVNFTVYRQAATVRDQPNAAPLLLHMVKTGHGQAGAVCIAYRQTTTGRQFLLAKHWRATTGQWHWEFPRGMGLRDEDPVGTAQRELREETGLTVTPSDVTILQSCYSDTGVLCDPITIAEVNATAAYYSPRQSTDWELTNLIWLSQSSLTDLIRQGEVTDGLTLAAWCAYLCHN